ncbi:hypothetical protein [Microbacterium lacus]|uniref:hypothetical protein n=1 Tax=Microbacterium lacus TaxID=415217 RepID=UPI000C2B5689|nr:hypothetical protein [Microbacterium lacus]
MPKPAADLPAEKVSATDILDEIREADAHNRSVERARLNVSAIENQIRDLEAELVAARAALDEAAETSLADLIDTEPMRARLRDVEDINDAVRAAAEYHELEAQLARAADYHAAAQTNLDDIDARKRAALAEAVFPVDGLSVDEEGITFNGIPFSQTNSAARRSVAFAIATAGNPKLRLVIVKDGDLLDEKSVEAIEAMADERGYTVLMERDRDQSRAIGFTIVDGELQDAAG